ncbi:MAG: pyrroline-5-carboxylate reductase [Desulfobacterales bacterium]|jgi:pyrroline-5-carboxylate reductase|nr:pyrroline-5-carboxylate reductase [Desulfobacterales bacterium]
MEQKIGFVGAGNMAEAIIGAVIRAKLVTPENIFASDVRVERLDDLKKTYGITTSLNNRSMLSGCDIIFLAVKPQQINEVLSDIAINPSEDKPRRKLIISIAAGIRLEKIETALYASLSPEARSNLPIIRVMPNTPALVLRGMSGMSPNISCTLEDIENARLILASMGKVIQFQEKDLDAVTALSGSGPAYVFYLAELMIAAGIQLGLTASDSKALTITTMEGAVALLTQGNASPETLRAKVTSPGGTTAAAISHMEANGVSSHIVNAIVAAAERSRELSR